MNELELPSDFPHSPPEGFSYVTEQHNASTVSIWLLHHRRYVFCDNDQSVRTIWGFVKTKRGRKGSTTTTYFSPINSNKVGKEVDIASTTPYTSMQLNFSNALESALFGST